MSASNRVLLLTGSDGTVVAYARGTAYRSLYDDVTGLHTIQIMTSAPIKITFETKEKCDEVLAGLAKFNDEVDMIVYASLFALLVASYVAGYRSHT